MFRGIPCLHLIDELLQVHFHLAFLCLLCNQYFRLSLIKFLNFPLKFFLRQKGRRIFRLYVNQVISGRHQGHGCFRSVRKLFVFQNGHPFRHGTIQGFYGLPAGFCGVYGNVKIFPIAGNPHPQRRGKGHNLVGAVPAGIGNVNPCPPDCFLEIPHHVKMPDKFHHAIFLELNSDVQDRHLPDMP